MRGRVQAQRKEQQMRAVQGAAPGHALRRSRSPPSRPCPPLPYHPPWPARQRARRRGMPRWPLMSPRGCPPLPPSPAGPGLPGVHPVGRQVQLLRPGLCHQLHLRRLHAVRRAQLRILVGAAPGGCCYLWRGLVGRLFPSPLPLHRINKIHIHSTQLPIAPRRALPAALRTRRRASRGAAAACPASCPSSPSPATPPAAPQPPARSSAE